MRTPFPSRPSPLIVNLTASLDADTLDSLARRIADAVTVALRTPAPTKPPDTDGSAMPDRLLWTIRDVAKALQVCDKTVWNLRHSGQMPQPIMFGRTPRWNADTIRAWIAAREQEQAET